MYPGEGERYMRISFLSTTILIAAPIFGANISWAQSAGNAGGALLAQAQSAQGPLGASAGGLEEIVVTATKFGATNLSTTPITIAAISGAQLAARDVTGPAGLMGQV